MSDSLSCQRCRQPLIRDATVANITPSQYALIAGTLPTPPAPSNLPAKAKLDALPPASKASAEAWASANPITESYILLPDTSSPSRRVDAPRSRAGTPKDLQDKSKTTDKEKDNEDGRGDRSPAPADTPDSRPASPQGNRPRLAANLDALLSSRSNIDHPLCTECTGLFQAELQRELEELTRERDAYIAFERGLRKRADDEGLVGSRDEWEALVARGQMLEDEERELRATLRKKEGELEKAKDEEARVKADEEEVERDEAEFLQSHSALYGELTTLSNHLQSARTQLLLSQSLLAHLESTNVYNDAFQIGHAPLVADAAGGRSSNVGTINGLRLGGRPVVDFDEINAAWGLVALSIDRLAVKVGCSLQRYKIIPLGSYSRIEELPGKNSYELYGSGDLTPGRLWQNRQFSSGLVALLDCLRQLLEYGRETGRAWGSGVE